MRIHSVLHAALVISISAGLVSPLAAQEGSRPAKKAKAASKAKDGTAAGEVVVDPATAALLDRGSERLYAASRDGVTKASCAGEVLKEVPGKPPEKADFRYEWDGNGEDPSGKMTFSDPSRERELMKGTSGSLDFCFRESPGGWREEYAGCRLVATKEGKKTRIRVAGGKSKSGITELLLNADALPEETTLAPPTPPPGVPAGVRIPGPTMKTGFVKLGERFGMSKMTMIVNGTPMKDVAIEYGLVKEHHLPVKVTETTLKAEVKDRSSKVPSSTISLVPAGTRVSMQFKDWQFEEAEKSAKSKVGPSGK